MVTGSETAQENKNREGDIQDRETFKWWTRDDGRDGRKEGRVCCTEMQ